MASQSESTGAGEGRRTEHGKARVPRSRGLRAVFGVPLAVVSTVAVTLGIVQPAEAAPQTVKRQPKAKGVHADGTRTARVAATATPPAEYLVVDGDTIIGIAERFGLATAEVLALNGLGWSSLIFPGQRLALPGGAAAPAQPPPAETEIRKHVVVAGDTVSGIAAAYGVGVGSILSANGLGASSLIFPGESIVLPPSVSGTPAHADAAPPAPDPAPAAAPAAPETHTVAEGESLYGIAAAHGLTVADLDQVNGLGGSTVIVPGQVLAIRRPETVLVEASVNVPLDDEMRGHASIIIEMGRALGVPDQGIVVALAAAAQESGLRNVRHGDRDSLGLFQQRPSQGWGTVDEVLDPVRATAAFYGGAANPNPGRTNGLLDIPGWEAMTVTQAAQSVQLSEFPDHYAKWEAAARAWLSELG
ncbi:LysM peptidoglycan-binding domain-containing protein [Agromyces sp. NPDC049794]|uniref:muramidase family protein n=1 Tax=unclassified Agromyces TaxID=2639701 RepID=UPI0034115D40